MGDNLNNLTLSHRKYTPRTRVLNHELRPLKVRPLEVKILKKKSTESFSKKKNTILNPSTKHLKVKPSIKETTVYTKLKRSLNSFYRTKKSILSDSDKSKKNKTLLKKKINLEKKINLFKKLLPFFTKTKGLKKVVFLKKDTKILKNFEKIYLQNRGGIFDTIKSNNNFKNFFLKNLKVDKSSESIQKNLSLNKTLTRFSKYSRTLEKTYEPSMEKNQLDPITSLKNLIIDKKIKTKQINSLRRRRLLNNLNFYSNSNYNLLSNDFKKHIFKSTTKFKKGLFSDIKPSLKLNHLSSFR